MSNKPEIPFVLRHEEAENKIFNAVSESAKTIPFCSIESILTCILHQVREQAKAERTYAAKLYEKQMEEYKEKEAEKEGEQNGLGA